MNNWPSWDDASLAVASDDKWRRKYRRLQSWFRETKLRTAPDSSGGHPLCGSMLSAKAVAVDDSLNFYDANVARYALTRAADVIRDHGTVDLDRLKRNMLSSMPLCFNVFGFLRDNTGDAGPLLGSLFELPIHRITTMEVEYAPDSSLHLGDKTAFDAFVTYTTRDGRKGFVGRVRWLT